MPDLARPGRAGRPRIAITVGDPAGIGPEIAEKAAADARVLEACDTDLYGPRGESARAYPAGVLSAAAGRAAYDAILAAVADIRAGRADALVTAPINKEAFALAGLPWKGHTDLLGHLTGAPRAVMMFASPTLRVSLATVHVPLVEVASRITVDSLSETIAISAESLPWFGCDRPRLAVAAINPHAGEHGLMGNEDDTIVRPAVERCRASGCNVVGPIPGDTVFVRAVRGEFDLVVAAYHDQGLIPIKLLAFGSAVNVTLGLPIVRTSVDHGTAFDIAGRGVADPGSLVEAVLLAASLTRARGARRTSPVGLASP
ncbi:MAG: 4-hydroxythreonine-4-phosphate dehydrogenase PdxA [Vicinamibacterales bacterium]